MIKGILIVIVVTKKIMKKQRNKVQTSRSVAGDASIRLRPHDIPICKSILLKTLIFRFELFEQNCQCFWDTPQREAFHHTSPLQVCFFDSLQCVIVQMAKS